MRSAKQLETMNARQAAIIDALAARVVDAEGLDCQRDHFHWQRRFVNVLCEVETTARGGIVSEQWSQYGYAPTSADIEQGFFTDPEQDVDRLDDYLFGTAQLAEHWHVTPAVAQALAELVFLTCSEGGHIIVGTGQILSSARAVLEAEERFPELLSQDGPAMVKAIAAGYAEMESGYAETRYARM